MFAIIEKFARALTLSRCRLSFHLKRERIWFLDILLIYIINIHSFQLEKICKFVRYERFSLPFPCISSRWIDSSCGSVQQETLSSAEVVGNRQIKAFRV